MNDTFAAFRKTFLFRAPSQSVPAMNCRSRCRRQCQQPTDSSHSRPASQLVVSSNCCRSAGGDCSCKTAMADSHSPSAGPAVRVAAVQRLSSFTYACGLNYQTCTAEGSRGPFPQMRPSHCTGSVFHRRKASSLLTAHAPTPVSPLRRRLSYPPTPPSELNTRFRSTDSST